MKSIPTCIDIEDIVPKERVVGSKRSVFKIDRLGNSRAKVYYDPIKGKGPKPFMVPEKLEITERIAEALGLYVGDGNLGANLSHSGFSNKDPELVRLMLNFFYYMGARLSDMTMNINYRNGNKKRIKKWWRNEIGIEKAKIKIRKSGRCRFSVFVIQVNGVIFRIILGNLIEKIVGFLFENADLRRGFLRGLFAAEGCIAVKEGYINHISIAFNPKTEARRRDLYRGLLDIEGIPTSLRESGSKGEIYIRNWVNYYRLWNIGISDACSRKKARFIDIIRNLKVYIVLEDVFRKELFNSLCLTQRGIAKILHSHQGNISRNIKGNILLSVEQIIKLISFLGKKEFSIEKVIDKTRHIRVGNLTTIENIHNDFLQTLFELKSC